MAGIGNPNYPDPNTGPQNNAIGDPGRTTGDYMRAILMARAMQQRAQGQQQQLQYNRSSPLQPGGLRDLENPDVSNMPAPGWRNPGMQVPMDIRGTSPGINPEMVNRMRAVGQGQGY